MSEAQVLDVAATGAATDRGGGINAEAQRLLPCPFCGGRARVKMEVESLPDEERPFWIVTCCRDSMAYRKRMGKGCPAGPMAIGDSRQDAVSKWNTRHGGAA